jgi:hypothetical protein
VPVGTRQLRRLAEEGEMPFIASNGLTEEGTSKTVTAGITIHYHDLGTGEPVAVPPFLRPRNHRVDYVSQDGR